MKKEALDEMTEHFIDAFEDLKEKYCTDHVLFDFYPGEYVKCTYRKGEASYLKVYGIKGEDVVVSRLNDLGEFELIRPNLLKKVDLNPKWVKILYSNK